MTECDAHLTESGTLAFRVALSVLRHREDAEDVAQEAVVCSLQRFNSLRDRARFRSWLVRIAWRLAIDRRRADTRRGVRDFHLVAVENGHHTVEHDLIQRERARRLWAAIDDLPLRLRLPLVLGTLQGHSLDEVASLLRLPVGTVKSRSFEARRQLKKALMSAGVVSALIAVAVMTWSRLTPRVELLVIHSVAQVPSIDTGTGVAPEIVPRETSHTARIAAVAAAAETEVLSVPHARPALPGVTPLAIPTIEIQIVETRVVRLPIVQVPVVSVSNIEIPAVKAVSAGSSETHQEKQR